MSTVFRKGDVVQLTEQARARKRGPGIELGTICRLTNPVGRGVKVLWDSWGSRDGLYYRRELLRKVDVEPNPERGNA